MRPDIRNKLKIISKGFLKTYNANKTYRSPSFQKHLSRVLDKILTNTFCCIIREYISVILYQKSQSGFSRVWPEFFFFHWRLRRYYYCFCFCGGHVRKLGQNLVCQRTLLLHLGNIWSKSFLGYFSVESLTVKKIFSLKKIYFLSYSFTLVLIITEKVTRRYKRIKYDISKRVNK